MQVRMTLLPGIINYCSSLSYKHGSFVFFDSADKASINKANFLSTR